ncbi:FG-GAP-like repeat-containing protein, partial [Candidatus Eisenbacteria bacterium]
LSRVYRNDAGLFTDSGAGLEGVRSSSVAWGDYDNDGDLDILLTGEDVGGTYISRVYRNDAGLFTDIGTGLEGVRRGSVAWGDYDNDGDLDILLTGESEVWHYISRAYRNDAGLFTDIGAGLQGVEFSSVAWGDYDNDGDLDILLTGEVGGFPFISRVYRNDGVPANTPPEIPDGLVAEVQIGQVRLSWDASTDGQTPSAGLSYNLRVGATPGGSEIMSAMADGASGYRRVAQLGNVQERISWTLTLPIGPGIYYWSIQAVDGAYAGSGFAVEESFEAAGFVGIVAGLEGVQYGSVAWGDYDSDGDLDILLTGEDVGGTKFSLVYRNDAGLFTDIGAGLPGVANSSVAWGDYDNDGDLDILLTGLASSDLISHVYRNDAGLFTDIGAGLPGVWDSSVAWGDYDNDGDLDILLSGDAGGFFPLSRVYRNDAGLFADSGAGLLAVQYSSVAWGDYDNDGDLDILLAGADETVTPLSLVYRNYGVPTNTPPETPDGLAADVDLGQVALSWDTTTDGQTPSAGLLYNLRIGTTPGGSEIMSSMADAACGYRRVVQLGNAQEQTSWTVMVPLAWQTYYWSVQALDGAFAGSVFAVEDSFLGYGEPPLIASIVDVPNDQGRQVRISWLRSGHDALGSPTPIEEYAIFRRINEIPRGPAGTPPEINDGHGPSGAQGEDDRYPPGDWDFIATVPADTEDYYSMVVPTLGDSTIAEGMYWSVFFVRARTDTPGFCFDCEPDSGYSVDNLAPGVPSNLVFDGPDLLVWDEALEEDFAYHTVYGSQSPVLDDTAALIGYTIAPTYDVSGESHDFYHVTTSDHADNESGAAGVESPTSSTPEGTPLPTRFVLRVAQPNPFRSQTSIGFNLPVEENVQLVVYDTSGRQVRVLARGLHAAGQHIVSWDGSDEEARRVAPGVY